MSKQDDGGPAFPQNRHYVKDYGWVDSWADGIGGMSLRDWFAGQALAGMLGSDPTTENDTDVTAFGFYRQMASVAYRYADAMLAERSKE